MMKLYRININMLDDPLENKRLLELVGTERRKKVIRYRMPDDRKRSVGAGIIINKILDENLLQTIFFSMYPMQEIMLLVCHQTVRSDVILKKL